MVKQTGSQDTRYGRLCNQRQTEERTDISIGKRNSATVHAHLNQLKMTTFNNSLPLMVAILAILALCVEGGPVATPVQYDFYA